MLISVLSLRAFDHEFTRFLKKHYPWSDLTNQNTPTHELYKITGAMRLLNFSSLQTLAQTDHQHAILKKPFNDA